MSFDEKVPKLSTLERYDYAIIENELTKRGWRLPRESEVPELSSQARGKIHRKSAHTPPI